MKEQDNKERLLNERLLDDYRQAVCAMLEANEFRRIENSSPKHAAIIIEEMIGHAKHSFCAVAQRMNPDVWSPCVIDALTKAVKGGSVAVSLLVVTPEALTHLEGIDPELRSHIRRAERPDVININFAVMDDKAVRIEHDVANDRATFCVNEAELASLAKAKFDALYTAGTSI